MSWLREEPTWMVLVGYQNPRTRKVGQGWLVGLRERLTGVCHELQTHAGRVLVPIGWSRIQEVRLMEPSSPRTTSAPTPEAARPLSG